MFQNDYVMRQIENMVRFVAMLMFGRAAPQYVMQDEQRPTEGDLLHKALIDLLGQGNINGAEDLLFEHLERGMDGTLQIVLDFYDRLNHLSDEQLVSAGFSRDEVDVGFQDALRIIGVEDLLDMAKPAPR